MPMSAAIARARAISSSLSFHVKRMYRQFRKGTSRPARAFSSAMARSVARWPRRSRPRRRYCDVGVLRRAVDGERHLVDAASGPAGAPGSVKREAVRARVEVDVREVRLDVLAHLHGALVQEGLAVVEEVDADQRRPASSITRLNRSKSSMPACRVRVMPVSGAQQASVAGDVAGGGALDVEARGEAAGVERPRLGGSSSRDRGSFSGQSPQNVEPPAFRSARRAVTVGARPHRLRRRPGARHRARGGRRGRRSRRPAGRRRASRCVLHGQEHCEPGGEEVQGHAGGSGRGPGTGSPLLILPCRLRACRSGT